MCRQEHSATGLAYRFDSALEVNNDFALGEDGILTYCKNIGGVYQLCSYDLNKDMQISRSSGKNNKTKPFFYKGSWCYLEEEGLTNKFKLSDSALSRSLGTKYCTKIVSSENGKHVLLQSSDGVLHLFSADGRSDRVIDTIPDFNGGAISEEDHKLVISAGNRLYITDIENGKRSEIAGSVRGMKTNPSIGHGWVCFSSYDSADRYGIYGYALGDAGNGRVQVLARNENDLRMPRTDGRILYYIEVRDGEYLLRSKDLRTGAVKKITEKGVTYSYGSWKDKLIFIYSDMNTPRGIRCYHTVVDSSTDLDCSHIQTDFDVRLMHRPGQGPPAYCIKPLHAKISGIILYFHPGRENDDVSPRWDNMIFPLCNNGYALVLPNFPSSTGYGRTYEQQPFDAAVDDMGKWIDEIHRIYPSIPLYLYGISSGCALMERCLVTRPEKIRAAISSFGLVNAGAPVPVTSPILYVLGEQDPVTPYAERSVQLRKMQDWSTSNTILGLEEEGHWIQQPTGFYDYFDAVFSFLRKND